MYHVRVVWCREREVNASAEQPPPPLERDELDQMFGVGEIIFVHVLFWQPPLKSPLTYPIIQQWSKPIIQHHGQLSRQVNWFGFELVKLIIMRISYPLHVAAHQDTKSSGAPPVESRR
mmetsp:Transcript_27392/g.60035  ORF Transcript_27392/g.60035 Transcript_27392/m.60035 type:complete len:118 (+) Transcript_27392:2-355(+)